MSERNMWIGVKGVDRRVADSEHGPQVLGEQEVDKAGSQDPGVDSGVDQNEANNAVVNKLVARGLPLDELVPRSWRRW